MYPYRQALPGLALSTNHARRDSNGSRKQDHDLRCWRWHALVSVGCKRYPYSAGPILSSLFAAFFDRIQHRFKGVGAYPKLRTERMLEFAYREEDESDTPANAATASICSRKLFLPTK